MSSIIVDGVRLAFRVDGEDDAPPIVLINSLGTDLRMWERQIASLSFSFRVIRYDIRGHGQSGMNDEPISIERLGKDLLALLDYLAIARAHICGVSLGGMIALWLAIHHPERIARAIFSNTAARIGTLESWNTRIEAVQNGGMAAVRSAVVARFLSKSFRDQHPNIENWIGEMIEATNPSGYVAACVALRDADLRPLITTIRVPSLIIAGELDESTTQAQAEELHDAIRDSELMIFHGVAHLSNVEQPEQFNACLLRRMLSDA